MSNKNRSQASTLKVVAKDNLRTDGSKRLLFTEQKEQNAKNLPQAAYSHNGRVNVLNSPPIDGGEMYHFG